MNLRSDVEALAVPRNRLHHVAGIERAEQHLCAGFAASGWRVERQGFRVADVTGVNVLAWREGPSPEVVLLGAHYDTVRDSPGADDNAAAVAVLLEVARRLPECRRTVLLAAFDMEEWGLLGSRDLAPRLARRVRSAVILESVAYTSSRPGSQRLPEGFERLFPEVASELWRRGMRGDATVILHRSSSAGLAQRFAGFLPPEALPLCLPDPGAPDFARSDHLPFWEAGVPAIMVTDSANFRNPHYHTPGDTPDTLDHERLAAVAEASLRTVEAEAG